MNNDRIDSLIMDALSQDNIAMTEDINDMIGSTLENLPQRKSTYKRFKLANVAAIFLALIIGISTISYATTGEIPVVKDLIGIFEESYTVSPKFREYLNMNEIYSVKDKGVTISLLGAMASDMGFTAVTKIDYDKDVKTKIPNEVAGALYVNGEYRQFNGVSLDTERVNENTFIKMINIDTKNFDDKTSLPVKYDFEYKINGLTGVPGKWNLKGSIDNTKLVENTITKTLNKEIDTKETELYIEKFLINPISAKIYYKQKCSDVLSWLKQKDIYMLNSLILIDNEKRSYLPKSGFGSGSGNGEVDYSLEFLASGKIPKSVTIIPMIQLYKSDPKVDNTIKKRLKPQKLDFGELGNLDIKKIVKEKNEIKITVKKEGLAPLQRLLTLKLKGKLHKEILICDNLKQAYSENKDEFTMIFKNARKFEIYNIVYDEPYKVNIYKDKAVTIDLTK